jgi:hypothetical protein
MDCQAAEITDDESSVQMPIKTYRGTNEGTGTSTPDVERMREKIFKDKNQESMLQDEDITVEEDCPTYSQDTQEYMHWHYKLNHPMHTVMNQDPVRHGKATHQATHV